MSTAGGPEGSAAVAKAVPRRQVRATDRATAQALGELVGRLIRTMRRGAVAPMGPSATSTLSTVDRSGPIRLGELADREGITPPTLSRIVAGLENDGMVERQIDPEDRRSAFLNVTELGHTTIQDLNAARGAVMAELMTRLSPDEIEQLREMLPLLERLVADE
jgi:DNA-binding MarR family transcriptional regulator